MENYLLPQKWRVGRRSLKTILQEVYYFCNYLAPYPKGENYLQFSPILVFW